ncbi:MAG: LLM class flavin-dependent oxidoreductase [Actinomycetia bacterium]|nr:LLM class flavin-dependent oxidoreductase [Actinomycetes bacterium]
MLVDVQFSSAANEWPALRDAVLQAEADGHNAVWVFDHFDGTLLGGDRPVMECFTLLGALAAATSTIRVGSMVANVANRHAAVLAAAAQTVQRISNGRLLLGIGAGGAPDSPWAREHKERGIELSSDLAQRHAAVLRQIEAVRALSSSATQPIPILVGVNSIALATIAGTHADGVNVRLSSSRAAEQIGAARAAAGDRSFETTGWAHATDQAAHDKAQELNLDRLIITRLGPLDRSAATRR